MMRNRKSVGRQPVGDAVQIRFVEVTARDNESPELLIKRFSKKVRNDGVLDELMDRRFFVKPSVKRRMKRNAAIFKSRIG